MNQPIIQPVLIAGEWRAAHDSSGTIRAINPTNREPLPDLYPISGRDDVLAALRAGHEAAAALRETSPAAIATFLEHYADLIEANREQLVELAHRETGLPREPRLNAVELPRTTNQLRQAAAAARSRSWTNPVIDRDNNIRSIHAPLGGPVVVFGPNNFPFAYNSVAGGDFAAAIATHNPVIAKAHPNHPGTTKLLAELAFAAAQVAELPAATVQLLYHLPNDLGLELVSHPLVGATGFTGSRRGGLALKAAADHAGKPIYLEMSSVNPVFVLRGALEERFDSLVAEFCTSCTMAVGQFCTNPGLVVVPAGDAGQRFVAAVAARFSTIAPGVVLNEGVLNGLVESVRTLVEHGAQIATGGSVVDDVGLRFANTLLHVSGEQFLAHPNPLQHEAFGPASLVVLANDDAQMLAIAQQLEGALTGGIYSHADGRDDALYADLEPLLRVRVGRLLNDKMPTGVAVSPAMNHGGPFPASGHAGFTAVGIPAALRRFTALHCYDNVRPHRLPAELRD